MTGHTIIIADWKVYAAFAAYFVLTLLCFDQAHYSRLEGSEMCVSVKSRACWTTSIAL